MSRDASVEALWTSLGCEPGASRKWVSEGHRRSEKDMLNTQTQAQKTHAQALAIALRSPPPGAWGSAPWMEPEAGKELAVAAECATNGEFHLSEPQTQTILRHKAETAVAATAMLSQQEVSDEADENPMANDEKIPVEDISLLGDQKDNARERAKTVIKRESASKKAGKPPATVNHVKGPGLRQENARSKKANVQTWYCKQCRRTFHNNGEMDHMERVHNIFIVEHIRGRLAKDGTIAARSQASSSSNNLVPTDLLARVRAREAAQKSATSNA